jgi:rubrerythrin
MTGSPVSRRELLARTVRPALVAQADPDERIVGDTLLLERTAIASYDVAVAAAQRLPAGRARRGQPPLPELLSRLRAQEREHADVLASALDSRGGRPAPVLGDLAALARTRAQAGLKLPLEGLRTQAAIARFAIELENAQLARYLSAVRDLRDARLVELSLQIMGAEGQHAVVLRGLLSDAAGTLVPEAFERGESAPP